MKSMRQVLNDLNKSILWDVSFKRGIMRPLIDMYVRRIGRPRQNWTEQVLKFYNVITFFVRDKVRPCIANVLPGNSRYVTERERERERERVRKFPLPDYLK